MYIYIYMYIYTYIYMCIHRITIHPCSKNAIVAFSVPYDEPIALLRPTLLCGLEGANGPGRGLSHFKKSELLIRFSIFSTYDYSMSQ